MGQDFTCTPSDVRWALIIMKTIFKSRRENLWADED